MVSESNHNSVNSPLSTARKPSTIYDVAERANVSIRTVSKVVNEHPEVSLSTRARVMGVIAELRYRPNMFARQLARKRSFMIGLLCDAPTTGSGYLARIQMSVLAVCQKKGFHLIVECLHPHDPDIDHQVRALASEFWMAGVILTPPLCDSQQLIQALNDTRTPIVRISPETRQAGLIDLDIDNQHAAHEMTNYLIGLGHRRIGFVRGPTDHPDANARFTGYRAALLEAGLPFSEYLCARGLYTYRSGVEAGDHLLALDPRPTAIFAANDDMAAGVIASSLRFNLQVPGDLSIAGFDDAMFSQAVWPQLTTCRQPIAEMAEIAASMLILQDSERRPEGALLKHSLIVRGSTAAPTCP